MDDLIERLRALSRYEHSDYSIGDEAAAEIEALRARTAVTMGVGTGDGKLFVHGDHDSIKAAQAIVLQRDTLRAEVSRQEALKEKHILQSDGWEHRAHASEARAERLAEALRPLAELDLRPDGFDKRPDSQVFYARDRTAITVGDVRRAQAALRDQ